MRGELERVRILLTGAAPRFALLSTLSMTINLGVTTGLKALAGVPGVIGFAIALALSMILNFAGLRYYVYPGSAGKLFPQFVAFASASIGFRLAEYMGFVVLEAGFGVHEAIAVFIILSLSLLMKFSFYANVVFQAR